MATPLPKDSWQRMEEVVDYPYLRVLRGIGHTFIDETRGNLQVGGNEFLLLKESRNFEKCWNDMGKPSSFFATRERMRGTTYEDAYTQKQQ